MTYNWTLDNKDPGHANLMQALAQDEAKGDLNARYQLSLFLSREAPRKSLALLRSAAEQGHAQAQFDLGNRYEHGYGLAVDVEEATRWYRKAAAQGHVLAVQRLQIGAPPAQ